MNERLETARQIGIDYEPCIVSFIDVLGFRTLIAKRSAADVHGILRKLERFTRPDEEEAPRSMDEVRLYSSPFAQTVSDAIVRVRPYNTQFRDGAFCLELIDLLDAQIDLIAASVLIRAGMTVGDAYVGYSGEGPIFGPAVVRAYEIESQEAIFPRIVIDDHAIEQHRSDVSLRGEQNTLEYELELVDRLLDTSEDGTHYIDYLHASTSEFDTHGDYLEFLSSHADLVRQGRSGELDRRTRRKYEWLTRYHDGCVTEILERANKSEDYRRYIEAEFDMNALSYLNNLLIIRPA